MGMSAEQRFEAIMELLLINLDNINLSIKPREVMLLVPKDLIPKLPSEVVSRHTGDKVMIMEI